MKRLVSRKTDDGVGGMVRLLRGVVCVAVFLSGFGIFNFVSLLVPERPYITLDSFQYAKT